MTPFVPTIVSMITAATVCGPSYCSTSSKWSPVQTGHGSGWPAGRIARRRDRAACGAVVRAVARDDLVPARVPARDLDRVLVRLRAAVREERHREVPGRDLGEQARELRARLGRHRRGGYGGRLGSVPSLRAHPRGGGGR